MNKKKPSCPIAVIGLGCWYPDARNPIQFWENILARRRAFRRMPDQRTPLQDYYHSDPAKQDKTYLKTAALIDGFDFDWKKRRIPYSTFKSTDTVHWLALEIAMAALADAGYQQDSIPGQQTGVIVGNTLTGEQTRANGLRLRWPLVRRALHAAAKVKEIEKDTIAKLESNFEKYFKSITPPIDEDSLAGGLSNTIAGRICNYLNLDGGGYTVDGACSSSLLAVATAATGLMNGDLNLALAGGVDISLDPFEIIGFAKAGALTPDDMRVYDRRGNGFLPGEGCGFVVLKRLDDAQRDEDDIYAILHGWGISSDGRGTSITAPNPKGQAEAIKRAYERAPFNPTEIDFIEGHGTGTAVGDQVELQGIARAMKFFHPSEQDDKRFCGMTSLKSLIGHTKAAAGIGAFIKAVMAVNRRVLPPTAGCRDPHPVFESEAKSLYPILSGKTVATKEKLRAGISAMGFGGINCHVCIESADPPVPKFTPSFNEKTLIASHQETELFIFSTKTLTEMITQVETLIKDVRDISIADLTDLAADLARKTDTAQGFRVAIMASHPDQLAERLSRLSGILNDTPPDSGKQLADTKHQIWAGNQMTAPRIGFLFPGQGSQQLNMAKQLIDRYDWARDVLAKADTLLSRDNGSAISPFIYCDLDPALGSNQAKEWARILTQTEHAQPAICLHSLIWLNWLKKVGIRPTAVGGHSLGELTAFHTAGAFDADTLIRLAGFRGKIFAEQAEKSGTMVSLRCSREKAEYLLSNVDGYAILSNINSPRQMVIAGEEPAIDHILKTAAKGGIPAFRLAVSGAFHTKLVSDAAQKMGKTPFLPPRLKKPDCQLFSGMDGREIKSGQMLNGYFSDQVLTPVDFIALVQSMVKTCDLFIEVGPGQALTGMVNDINGDTGPLCLPVESLPGRDQDINQLLGVLFVHHAEINWKKVYEPRLSRPFISPSERLFFENPCERPFDTSAELEVSTGIPHLKSLESLFAGIGNISQEKIDAYLKTRGPFIARVIQADMDLAITDAQWQPIVKKPPSAEPDIPSVTEKDNWESDKEIDSILFDTLESITGFSRDTLTPDMRLLDDLNLDSIKTGDLLTRVAKSAGILGEIKPLDFSNVTLEDIIQNLTQARAQTTKSVKLEKPDILGIILDQISKITGNRPDEINADALLQKDLNIEKDQLKKLLPDLSHRIKIDIHVDLDPLLKRTLRQIASILQRISEKQQPRPVSSHKTHRPPWVREFHVSMAPQSLQKTIESKRREDNWQFAHALVLCDDPENEVAAAMASQLTELGARVDVQSHASAIENHLPDQSQYSHFFNILPNQVKTDQTDYDSTDLINIVTRLSSATTVAPASRAPRRRNTVTYLQFGGGYFGTHAETAFLDRCGATALAASIHQERPDLRVRVLDFSPDLSADIISKKTIEEITIPGPFSAVGYDRDLVRRERYQQLMDPGTYKARSFTWSKKDVILVTGGAKGITAECALGVADASGARMALVGRSPLPDSLTENNPTNDIISILNKYSEKGLTARYFSCDVSDRRAVNNLIKRIKKEMGSVTGVIHGAGLNKPKVTNKVSIDEAIQEVTPKVLGALNLMAALNQTPPKLFIGLTSLSGITGMHGNGWYGFSNEALDIILHRFESNHPDTRTLSVAYSIWKDKGMGPRMGFVNPLGEQGISAIHTDEGVERFVRLFFNDPGVHQVIVAARLSGLDTWNYEPQSVIRNARFLENPLHVTPGVESAFRVHLSLDKDVYLVDHQFNDSYLFPAVFGLEAMAQAVSHVAGIHNFDRVRIENINLTQPITIDPKAGTDILIWAEVEVHITGSTLTIVNAGIYQPGIGTNSDSFTATFIFGLNKKSPKHQIRLPKKPLEIYPGTDLYRKTQLFLGPRFQRIKTVWALESTSNNGTSIVSTEHKQIQHVASDAFSNPNHHTLILGDMFFRDSLFQSAAIIMPQETSLPIHIDRLDLYPNRFDETGSTTSLFITSAEILSREDNEANSLVIATDSNGNIVERIEGFRLRILAHNDNNPSVADLLHPDPRDTRIIQTALAHCAKSFNIETPSACMAYLPDLHKLSHKQQHRKTLPLLKRTAWKVFETMTNPPEDFSIKWDDANQPAISVKNHANTNLSFSYDNRLCLAIAGNNLHGCCIKRITSASREEWNNLLGKNYIDLLDSLITRKDTLDQAATRILINLEIIRKKIGSKPKKLNIIHQKGDSILIGNEGATGEVLILSFPLRFTRGKERFLAFTVNKIKNIARHDILMDYDEYKELFRTPAYDVIKNGPQGQEVFVQRLPMTFKHNAQLSRTVYFSNYFFWLGDVRDYSAWPVLKGIGEKFATGKWGVVTNKTRMKITGEASVHDQVEIRFWASGNGGPANSTMELTCDFLKISKEGEYERLAWCEQTTTWVEILNHGIVKPAPYPDFYWNTMKEMLPKYDAPNAPTPLYESLSHLKNSTENNIQFQSPSGPLVRPILHKQIIDTSIEDANVVGNIYFAHYYAWQGRVRDHYFYSIIPEYFRGIGEKGELLCLECSVDHLREAMPFDRIELIFALKTWKACSAIFNFDYFRIESDGTRVKLASGEHEAIWVTRNKKGEPIAAPFPKPVEKAFRQAISDMT